MNRRDSILAGAASLAVAATVVAGYTTPAVAAAAPTDSFDEPVYLIKGYAPAGEQSKCRSRWSDAIGAMKKRGWTGPLVRVGFYTWDNSKTGCDVNLGDTDGNPATPPKGSRDTDIKELGRRLAWNIYNEHSSQGRSVDLLGHSMGGLIARAAIAGYQLGKPGWPPALYVEDVVTLGTPHEGTNGLTALLCTFGDGTHQCDQMKPFSSFTRWLQKVPNPQAAGGTDWTLICSTEDEVAPPGSSCSLAMEAHHLVEYPVRVNLGTGEKIVALHHSDLRSVTKGRFWMFYWNHGDPSFPEGEFEKHGASPIQAAQHALYWATQW